MSRGSVKEEMPKSILKSSLAVETLYVRKEPKEHKRHSLQIAPTSQANSGRALLEENKTEKNNPVQNLRATSLNDSVSRLRFEPDNVLARESVHEQTRKNAI